jgi:hypothetical protein
VSAVILMNQINPLRWKHEHQFAMILSIVMGFLFGLIFGGHHVSLYGHSLNLDPTGVCCDSLVDIRWALVLLWGFFGAGVAAVLVYIRQLLRA